MNGRSSLAPFGAYALQGAHASHLVSRRRWFPCTDFVPYFWRTHSSRGLLVPTAQWPRTCVMFSEERARPGKVWYLYCQTIVAVLMCILFKPVVCMSPFAEPAVCQRYVGPWMRYAMVRIWHKTCRPVSDLFTTSDVAISEVVAIIGFCVCWLLLACDLIFYGMGGCAGMSDC